MIYVCSDEFLNVLSEFPDKYSADEKLALLAAKPENESISDYIQRINNETTEPMDTEHFTEEMSAQTIAQGKQCI